MFGTVLEIHIIGHFGRDNKRVHAGTVFIISASGMCMLPFDVIPVGLLESSIHELKLVMLNHLLHTAHSLIFKASKRVNIC